ncbi:MAG: hypothetical protein ABI402_11205 [Ferruginibacter sp.]
MRDNKKYFPVNWIDGMKINKDHFIDQDNAWADTLQEMASLGITPLRYGVLPASTAGENTFDVKIALDNQNSLRVSVLSCQAVTLGGMRISIPAFSTNTTPDTNNILNTVFPFTSAKNESAWWIFLFVHPFEKLPVGSPDVSENPPRLPFVIPTYTVEMVSESNYREFSGHPYAMPIGRILVNGNDIKVEDDYLPPCFSIIAHPDLLSLHGELDKYFADVELYCSRIVQKIYIKKQQNEISELVMFLCDRVMLYLGQAISTMRWKMIYEAPVEMFMCIAALARIMKNTIDLRIGSGKDELMTYLGEWCELKQGELETMLSKMSNGAYNNNDINKSIQEVVVFVKTTLRLFETLSKLEFIGKKKESGIFVKEESPQQAEAEQKTKRRFFG